MSHSKRPVHFLSLLLLASGCGSGGPYPQPVHGQVLYNSRPIAEALIVFHPLGEYPKDWPKPTGYSDANGRFQLTTLRPNDGAAAGEYAITVEQREKKQLGEDLVRDGPNLLPPRYADSQSSGFRHQVQPGSNEVPALKLTGR
jgi:hypothetical protein